MFFILKKIIKPILIITIGLILVKCNSLKSNKAVSPNNYPSNCAYKNKQVNHLLKERFYGEWILKNESPFDSILTFQKETSVNLKHFNSFKFTFSKNQLLKHETFNRRITCGVSALYLSNPQWNIIENEFYLLFGGGFKGVSKFTYISKYEILSINENEFKIRVKKILQHKKTDS
jgi:hypothetical protein